MPPYILERIDDIFEHITRLSKKMYEQRRKKLASNQEYVEKCGKMDESDQSDGEYYVERDMQNFFSDKQSPMYDSRFQGLDEL